MFAGVISDAFQGSGQELFNASVLGIAVVMLMWHNAWMARHGREIADEMRRVGTAVSEGTKPLTALAVVIGLAVLREGSEVVLFLYGIMAQGTSGSALLAGGVLGIAAGAAFTALTYFGLLAIPNRHIFSVTSWLIALLAAGMAAQSVHFLNNAGLVVSLDQTVWDTSWLLSEGSILGRLLHILIGYTERPTEMQLLVYVAILIAMYVLMRIARPSPRRSDARCRRVNVSGACPMWQRRRPAPDRSISASARAGPRGWRLPCSQLRTVSIGTSIFSAKAACVSPQRARTWRTKCAGLL